MTKWLFSALLCLVAFSAEAQQVTLNPTDPQASGIVCATAPAVNATVATGTCTITVGAGHLYINYLQV